MLEKDNRKLMYENRVRSIEKLEGTLEEYKAVYGKYEKLERIFNRIRRWVTYPFDKCRALHMKRLFYKKDLRGLNNESREKRIIVSLTSYPKRIKYTPIAIASMMRQTLKPDKIVLYLAAEDFPNRKLPNIYKKIEERGVEIRFREDLKVHMKYYYAFKEFPDELVITIDDDILYKDNLIEGLYNSYLEEPNEIHAAYVDQLTFDDEAHLLEYGDWNFRFINKQKKSSHQFMALGVGGVLYSPNKICEEVFNAEMIKKLCPTADDIWLKFMEVISGIKVRNVAMKKTGTILRDTQKNMALGIINMIEGRNDDQIKAMVEYYNDMFGEDTLEEIMAYDK